MHSQNYPSRQNNKNRTNRHLHDIFQQNQIVQSYTLQNSHSLYFQSHQNSHKNAYARPQIFIDSQQADYKQKKKKRFIEDDIFQQLHSANIVENFAMVDEKEEQIEPYDHAFKGRGDRSSYMNQNMLASSSENNEVPSRNSSLSSLSEKNNYLNMPINSSLGHDNQLEKPIEHRGLFQTGRKSSKGYFSSNSENQMDVQNQFNQNSPIQQYNYGGGSAQKTKVSNQHIHSEFYNNQINSSKIEHTRNNTFINPEHNGNFPFFRRSDIDEEREKKQRLQKIEKIQQIGCNCRKTKCLKMYCECFNLQIFCNQNCNCVGCCNQESNQQHKKAVLEALTRNPKAFNDSTQKVSATFQLGIDLNQVKKGCKCRKTKCQKKYCECFNVGQKCGKFCKCEGCENC